MIFRLHLQEDQEVPGVSGSSAEWSIQPNMISSSTTHSTDPAGELAAALSERNALRSQLADAETDFGEAGNRIFLLKARLAEEKLALDDDLDALKYQGANHAQLEKLVSHTTACLEDAKAELVAVHSMLAAAQHARGEALAAAAPDPGAGVGGTRREVERYRRIFSYAAAKQRLVTVVKAIVPVKKPVCPPSPAHDATPAQTKRFSWSRLSCFRKPLLQA